MTTRNQTIFCFFLFMLVATAPEIWAQNYTIDIKPVRGFMPTADQVSSPIDSIDPVSGKLHTSVPLASLPRGRAGNDFDVALQYDSHLYDILPQARDYQINQNGDRQNGTSLILEAFSTGGWTYNFANFSLDLEVRTDDPYSCPTGSFLRVFRLRVGLPDGSQHILHLKDGGDAQSGDIYEGNDDGYFGIKPDGLGRELFSPESGHSIGYSCWTSQGWYRTGRLTYYTTDGSFLKLEIDADGSPYGNKTWYLYFPDGRIAEGRGSQIQKIRDANGNAIIFANTTSPAQTKIYHEEDGPNSDRAVIITYDYNYTEGTRTDTISGPGPNGRKTWTVNWELFGVGGDGRYYLTATDILSIFDWERNDPLGFGFWVVKDVQLPLEDATAFPNVWNSYAFEYSGNADCGYGEMKSMRTPSNSTYTYSYALEAPSNCLAQLITTETIAKYNKVTQRKVAGPGIPTLITQFNQFGGGTEIIAPDLSKTTHWYYPPELGLYMPFSGLVYRIDEPNGNVRKRVWAQNRVYDILRPNNHDPNNPFIQKETVTVGNSSGTPSKTMVTEYAVDKNGNRRQETQYDWVNYAGTYDGSTGIENGSLIKRITTTNYWTTAPDSGDNTSNDSREYWYPHTTSGAPEVPRRLNAVRRVDVGVPGANYSASEFVYDNPLTTGNLTTIYRWNNFSDLSTSAPGLEGLNSSNSQVLTRHYGSYGNLTQIDEPEVPTRITYDADGHFPTKVEYAYTNSAIRTWNYAWLTDGSLQSNTDADNGVATVFTYDDVGRPKTVIDIASGNNLRKTQTDYHDDTRKVATKRDLASFNDGKLQSITHYDELGRVILTQTSDGSPLNGDTDGIKVRTIYSAFTNGNSPGGHRIITSTPYRTISDATLEWSCSQLDPLGRVTDAAMFSGSAAPSDCTSSAARTGLTHTDFNADQVSVTDPASKVRRETRDGLGRLTTVADDPSGLNYSTTYTYDPLDRLTQVNQGSQERTFQYSSLGLLKKAHNPESGWINYTYTDSGDLANRIDDRGFSTTYGYDGLHRVLTKSYLGDAGVTPNVTYAYFQAGAPLGSVGQLQSMTSSAAVVSYGYDVLGRVQSEMQTTGGNAYTFQYSYRLNDGLSSMQYPSGKTVNYATDDAGRVNKVSTPSKTYTDLTAASAPFTADGRIAQMKLGNDLWESRIYQTPGSPTLLKLGTAANANDRLELEYNYPATINNGNLVKQFIRQPGHTWEQTFTYDGLNRLKTAVETNGFSQTYGYDQYGNRWVSASSGVTTYEPHEPTVETQINAAKNQIAGLGYDAAGNLINYVPWTLTYDAENRMISSTSPQNGNEEFAYDGDGRRVRKSWTPYGGTLQTTTYVYGPYGQLAAEYANQISSVTGTSWMFTDTLGSVRAITSEKPQSGSASITECYDYLPFGRMLSSSDNGRNTGCYPSAPDFALSSIESLKFTGKQRDAEIGLDFFGARYMSASQGRFTSPDPLMNSGRTWLPQSWNRYSYTLNNPLRFTDPTGLYEWDSKCKKNDSGCEENRQKFRDGVAQLNEALGKVQADSTEYRAIRAVLDKIGTEGDGNNVRVAFSSKIEDFGVTRPTLGGKIKMTFNFGHLEGELDKGGYKGDDVGFARAALIGHEGTHATESFGRAVKWVFSRQERWNFEGRAINTESLYYKSINRNEPFGPLWNPDWLAVDRDKAEQKRREAVQSMTEELYGGKPKLK